MWIEAILILLSIPTGILLAKLASDELVSGRKWFLALCLASFVLAVIGIVIAYKPIGLTSLFILICSAISYWASFTNLAKEKN